VTVSAAEVAAAASAWIAVSQIVADRWLPSCNRGVHSNVGWMIDDSGVGGARLGSRGGAVWQPRMRWEVRNSADATRQMSKNTELNVVSRSINGASGSPLQRAG